MNEMSTRVEDEQALVIQLQKKIKELQVKISLSTCNTSVLKCDVTATGIVKRLLLLLLFFRLAQRNLRRSWRRNGPVGPRWRSSGVRWLASWRS